MASFLPAIGAIGGGIAGGKNKKSSGGLPKFVKKQAKKGFTNLNAAAARTPEEAIAPQNADQLAAYQMARENIGLGKEGYADAVAQAAQQNQGISQADIEKFFNPFQQNVIDNSVSTIERARQRNLLGINDQIEKASAFGGSRGEVAKALANETYDNSIAGTVANLNSTGYQSALDAAFRNNDATRANTTGYLAALDAQRRAAGGDAAALSAVGDANRAYEQSLLDYPLEMAKAQINAAGGFAGTNQASSSGGGMAGVLGGMQGGLSLGQGLMGAFG